MPFPDFAAPGKSAGNGPGALGQGATLTANRAEPETKSGAQADGDRGKCGQAIGFVCRNGALS